MHKLQGNATPAEHAAEHFPSRTIKLLLCSKTL